MLLHDMRQAQARLAALADATPVTDDDATPRADVERFLEGLRHAWKAGEARPTSRRKPPAPRGRRRPDPLAAVTDELRGCFDEDPRRTGRELLAMLQAAHPDAYPDGLLRTVQRRLRIWRAEIARRLVFGTANGAPGLMAPDALRDLEASRIRGHQPHHPDIMNQMQVNFVRELYQPCLDTADMPRAWPVVPRYEHHGVRRRVHGQYLIFYRMTDDRITVLHILNGAMDVERILFPEG